VCLYGRDREIVEYYQFDVFHMCMFVIVCVYMCIYIYMHIYIYVYTYVRVCRRVSSYVWARS